MKPLEWCRQRMLVPGNPLTTTLPYASDANRDAILALRTVISEIAFATSTQSLTESGGEPVRARLAWWREALRAGSTHPAVEALTITGVGQRLDPADFDPLIEAVHESIDNPRFETTAEAWQFFRRLGGAVSLLEARLIEPELDNDCPQTELGAAGYLIRVVRDLAMDAQANRWLVPLDLQADFQVSRQDALKSDSTPGFSALVRTLLAEGVKRADAALDSIPPDRAWQHRHLLLTWAVDRHLAGRLARRPENILKQRIQPTPLAGSWAAWRAARRLRRNQTRRNQAV